MLAGDKIRQYRLQNLLGVGAQGEVWAAFDERLDRDVAFKIMRGSLVDNDQFRSRFLAEARRQAKLSHPNIPSVFDCFTESGASFLVLERVDGESLQKIIDTRGPLELALGVALAQDLLAALDFAHQRGIIHRDVKPSNILVNRQNSAKLIDFGISLTLGEARLTRTGQFVGTFEYSSPEQIRAKNVDHRTDVYSAGCVLYEMLTGRPPFVDVEDGGSFHVQHAQVFEKPRPLRELRPAIPEGIERVVLWSLEKDVEARLPGCGEFSRLLGEELMKASSVSGPGERLDTAEISRPRGGQFIRAVLIAILIPLVTAVVFSIAVYLNN